MPSNHCSLVTVLFCPLGLLILAVEPFVAPQMYHALAFVFHSRFFPYLYHPFFSLIP